MRKVLPILLMLIISSCSKKTETPPVATQPVITYTNAAKINSGSAFTVRLFFTVTNAAQVQSLQVYKALTPNNKIPVNPIVEGSQFVTDATPAGVGLNIVYYFDGTRKDGTKINQPFTVNY